MESVAVLFMFSFGIYAVHGFFVISGFLLTLSYLQKGMTFPRDLMRYIRRRSTRLLPAYYVGLALSLFIFLVFGVRSGVPIISINSFPTVKELITNCLLLQDVFHTSGAVNGDYWFMAMEFQLSLLFPVVILTYKYLPSVAVSFFWGFLIVLYFFIFPEQTGARSGGLMFFVFLMGMLAARVYTYGQTYSLVREISRFINWGCNVAFVVFALLLWCVSQPGYSHVLEMLAVASFGIGISSLLVLLSFGEWSWMTRLLQWRPLVYLGTISYSVYLVHSLVHRVMFKYVISIFIAQDSVLKFILQCTLDFPIILFVSVLFYNFVEHPLWLRWFVRRDYVPKSTS
jgi:peptidoglycan/LPS O-acetylase OafA/YrhL